MKKDIFFVLLPTLECNLRCDYCFEEHPRGRWDIRTTALTLQKLFEFMVAREVEACRLHWQGGEPLLLGRRFWNEVLPLAGACAADRGIRLTQSMQTNLIGYDRDIGALAKAHLGGTLGSSFEPVAGRRTRDGSWHRFKARWLDSYREARDDGISVGVLTLLNAEALEMGAREYLRVFREEYGIADLRFTLPFRLHDGHGYWLDAVAAGRFLADAYVEWLENGRDEWMEIRPFSHLAARILGVPARQPGLCIHSRNCADIATTVLPNGDVTLCDNFAHPGSDAVWGNIFRSSLAEIYGAQARLACRRRVGELVGPACQECRYLSACFGGCLVRSFADAQSGRPAYHYCATHKKLFDTILERGTGGAAQTG